MRIIAFQLFPSNYRSPRKYLTLFKFLNTRHPLFSLCAAMQRRNVYCQNSDGATISDEACHGIEKPVNRKECYNDQCKGTWKVGEWSEVSVCSVSARVGICARVTSINNATEEKKVKKEKKGRKERRDKNRVFRFASSSLSIISYLRPYTTERMRVLSQFTPRINEIVARRSINALDHF